MNGFVVATDGASNKIDQYGRLANWSKGPNDQTSNGNVLIHFTEIETRRLRLFEPGAYSFSIIT